MLEKSNPNFPLICTMMAQSQALQGSIYYSAGPPAMVASMRKMLVDAGVDEDDIRTEDFAGY
jgi:Na+-transporting NADH:ubiquinone oxidoreductase subunit NqrF